jgi:hypothetical protein
MAVEARRDTAWDIGVFQAICFDHGAEAGFDLSDHDLRDASLSGILITKRERA